LPDALRVKKALGKARHCGRGCPRQDDATRPKAFLAATRREHLEKTPLVVALLAQAASLGVVLRLDWRLFKVFALVKTA
jgi:hypothetical protein